MIKRDRSTCQKCGKVVHGGECHASHVWPRSGGAALMYDPQNIKILCAGCHLNWWHIDPSAMRWFAVNFPGRYAHLLSVKNEVVHWKAEDYERKISEIKKIIENAGLGLTDYSEADLPF